MKDLGQLDDDVVELLDVVGFGKVFFGPVLHALGDVLAIAGGAPNNFPDLVVAAVRAERFQDIEPGLDRHLIVEEENHGEFGGGAFFEISGNFLPVLEKFKGGTGIVFEEPVGQHFLVVWVVIREGNVRSAWHWLKRLMGVKQIVRANLRGMWGLASILGIFLGGRGKYGNFGGLFNLKYACMVEKDESAQEEWLNITNAEELYHKMVEEVEDYAILMLDSQGIIRNWNKGARRIKGYTEEEIVGNHFRVFYTKEDRDAGLPEKLIAEATRMGRSVHEGWRVRKDGTTFWGSIVITALHDREERVIGFSKVTRDLTARKVAEDKLVRYARQLETQNMELQQFAYAAAHDMKEPLRKVQIYYSVIEEEGIGMLSERQQAYLKRSAEAAARMQRLIEDLLAFTRMAEPVKHLEEVDLNAVVAEASALFQDSLAEVQGAIAASALPSVQGIPFQVRQVFVNLFGNSIKYREPGRPLRIEVSGSMVYNPGFGESAAYLPARFLKIMVSDNGMGFGAEHAERIFGMFERLHGRDTFEGTGIGLPICRKVMENHKGFIRAEGRPGEGAVFELFFPV